MTNRVNKHFLRVDEDTSGKACTLEGDDFAEFGVPEKKKKKRKRRRRANPKEDAYIEVETDLADYGDDYEEDCVVDIAPGTWITYRLPNGKKCKTARSLPGGIGYYKGISRKKYKEKLALYKKTGEWAEGEVWNEGRNDDETTSGENGEN